MVWNHQLDSNSNQPLILTDGFFSEPTGGTIDFEILFRAPENSGGSLPGAFLAIRRTWLGGGKSNILHFHPYLGKIPILTRIIFQIGWNQPDELFCFFFHQHLVSYTPMK